MKWTELNISQQYFLSPVEACEQLKITAFNNLEEMGESINLLKPVYLKRHTYSTHTGP